MTEPKQSKGILDFRVLILLGIIVIFIGLAFTGQGIHWGGFVGMLVFYLAVYYVGAFMTGDESSSAQDLMLAGRSMPLWIAMFTMTATWVGGGFIAGTAEQTYGSGLVWAQAPWGYALSLVIGGLFYARKMRHHKFVTMLDPLEDRFGEKMAAVLYLPALLGEVFWCSAILTGLGITFGTILGLDTEISIIVSALIAVSYVFVGGFRAVAYTDVIQLLILFFGLAAVVPLAAGEVGGMKESWSNFQTTMKESANLLPPWRGWELEGWGNYYWQWWDYALLLIFGGLPWHVYFQRVLSAKDGKTARNLSIASGFLCIVMAVPPVLIGVIGLNTDWNSIGVTAPEAKHVLPYVLKYLTSPWVAAIGLGALAAAVMSSVDSSILSASSMASWNVYRKLIRPQADDRELIRVIRCSVVIIGILATIIALKVQSVYALWFLCSDFVYTMLFPQLTMALFNKRANIYGSIAGLIVSFVLRIGGGEPALGIPQMLPYPMVENGVVLFPFRTLAMACGLLTIIVVSQLTQKICPPRPLLQREDTNG